MTYGKGAIGVPCREQARWSTFHDCLARLERPEGTLPPILRYNNSVAQARNQIAQEALTQGCDWVFWLDDDLLFAKDVLMKLLQHPEAIVMGLTLLRCTGDGAFRPIWSDTPIERGPNGQVYWTPVERIACEDNGLMRLLSGTGGGVLTRRAVFETVPGPRWWQQGQYDPEMFWEDTYFYERATEAGFTIWGDPTVRFGHYSPTVIWPHERPDGTWSTVLAHGFDGFLEQPWNTTVLQTEKV